MACMCGDTQCPSCGPAQGNSRCPICGVWMDDCCEHVDEDSGDLKPEFQAAADEAIRQESEREARAVAEELEAERLAEEYWRSREGE